MVSRGEGHGTSFLVRNAPFTDFSKGRGGG